MSSKTIVFIDAENVPVPKFEGEARFKIEKVAKIYYLDIDEIEYRAYFVEEGSAKNWKSDGVGLYVLDGKPKKDKVDNGIKKQLRDQAGKNSTCFLVTGDQPFISEVTDELDGVIVVDTKNERVTVRKTIHETTEVIKIDGEDITIQKTIYEMTVIEV